jgi:hypothetical protein
MAEAETDPTRIDDAASKAGPSNWLSIIKDVFPRWRDRLGSSKDAKDALEALLCDRETRCATHKVDASGEEILGTSGFLNAEFWPDRLLWERDADGGDDHLVVDYTDSADVYLDVYYPDSHWEFYVRRLDVERWERLHQELAAPPPPPPPPSPPPPPPQTTAGAETRAIAHLKPLLELRRDAMSKGHAWEECKQFNISYAGFENHVWPTARVQAGLERKAPAGRKPREPEDIKPIIDQIVGPAPGKKSRSQSPRKSRS